MEEPRRLAHSAIDSISPQLRELSQSIHSHPELCYEEVYAHDTITSFLETQGFTVKRHTYGLKTSFETEVIVGGHAGGKVQGKGNKVPLIIYCAEYDALPNIGHACGHNLIAISSVGAFVGAVRALEASGTPGKVRLLGTPAEEGGGGKCKLIDAGAFKGSSEGDDGGDDSEVAAAIMAHPVASGWLADNGLSGIAGPLFIASHKLRVEYRGRTAHAAGEPWNGVNALDAAVAAYNNISLMRQQIRPDDRIHGVIEDGGTVPNIIPEYTRMNWYIRSPSMTRADKLLERTKACFEAAAAATGCELKYIVAPTYKNLRANPTLCHLYTEEMSTIGEKILPLQPTPLTASTDMGNVSWVVPSFHGAFSIPAPPDVSMHNPGFAAAAATEEAHEAAIKAAKGMAMLGVRVVMDEEVIKGAKKDFETTGLE